MTKKQLILNTLNKENRIVKKEQFIAILKQSLQSSKWKGSLSKEEIIKQILFVADQSIGERQYGTWDTFWKKWCFRLENCSIGEVKRGLFGNFSFCYTEPVGASKKTIYLLLGLLRNEALNGLMIEDTNIFQVIDFLKHKSI